MEVVTSFTYDKSSTKEREAENSSLVQEWKSNPGMQWVQTLGATSSPWEIRCGFSHDNRVEGTMAEQRQGLKEKEYSAWQSWVSSSFTDHDRDRFEVLRLAQLIFTHINYIASLCTSHNVPELSTKAFSTVWLSTPCTSQVLSAQVSIEKSQILRRPVMELYAHNYQSLEDDNDQLRHT